MIPKLFALALSVSFSCEAITRSFCEGLLLGRLQGVVADMSARFEKPAFRQSEFPTDVYDSTLYRALTTKVFHYSDQTILVTRPELRDGSHLVSTAKAAEGMARYQQWIRQWIGFAIEQYDRRDWEESMFSDLLAVGPRYHAHSVYISSYLPGGDFRPENQLGVYRQVHAPFGATRLGGFSTGDYKKDFWMRTGVHLHRAGIDSSFHPRVRFPFPGFFFVPLPMEVLLDGGDQGVPRRCSWEWQCMTQQYDAVVEPGNFAVRKATSERIGGKQVSDRISFHAAQELIPQYESFEITRRGNVLFTFGEKKSEALHKKKNVEPLSDKEYRKWNRRWRKMWGLREGFIRYLEASVEQSSQASL